MLISWKSLFLSVRGKLPTSGVCRFLKPLTISVVMTKTLASCKANLKLMDCTTTEWPSLGQGDQARHIGWASRQLMWLIFHRICQYMKRSRHRMAGVGRDHGDLVQIIQWALLKQSHPELGVKDYVQRALSFPKDINSTTSQGTLTARKCHWCSGRALRVTVCAVHKVSRQQELSLSLLGAWFPPMFRSRTQSWWHRRSTLLAGCSQVTSATVFPVLSFKIWTALLNFRIANGIFFG